ncbi:MAG: hypothetical protein SFX73_00235 [Kofleriaceae bacterium]|nr:hypothetical protein [Kofleriaceae bacterium]
MTRRIPVTPKMLARMIACGTSAISPAPCRRRTRATRRPPTEDQAIRCKGDAYREYQKRVSRFIPLPPKSRGVDT